MSAPDHASLPVQAIRETLWRARLDARPGEALDLAFTLAHDAAEDAAREVLEIVTLPNSITMEPHIWEYFCRVLLRYDTTIPTGQRIGKRWCREFGGQRWIAEFTETSILWRKVTVTP